MQQRWQQKYKKLKTIKGGISLPDNVEE